MLLIFLRDRNRENREKVKISRFRAFRGSSLKVCGVFEGFQGEGEKVQETEFLRDFSLFCVAGGVSLL